MVLEHFYNFHVLCRHEGGGGVQRVVIFLIKRAFVSPNTFESTELRLPWNLDSSGYFEVFQLAKIILLFSIPL